MLEFGLGFTIELMLALCAGAEFCTGLPADIRAKQVLVKVKVRFWVRVRLGLG